MSYIVLLLSEPRKQLPHIPKRDRDRLYVALRELVNNPRPPGCVKLEGSDGWRVRVGDYRIVYHVDDSQKIVRVVRVRHRREAYR
jgi:mRNA interferase RelE/StbE